MDLKDLVIELLLEAKKNRTNEFMETQYINQVCMVRSVSAGVFFGKLVEKIGGECRLENARRVWYWEGAATLSQLAKSGTAFPKKCKFPAAVSSVELSGVIEIIPMTICAEQILSEVPIWEKI